MIKDILFYTGILSSYMVLSLTVWIAIQVSYIILAIYAPIYFKRLKEKKWKKHVLHFLSFLAGIISLLIPSMVTLGLGGYSSLDTKFPPIVCFAKNRDITAYMMLIPMGVLMALIITELILIFHFLMRYVLYSGSSNRFTRILFMWTTYPQLWTCWKYCIAGKLWQVLNLVKRPPK